MAKFEGAETASFNDTEGAVGFIEKLLNLTEGTVALLLNASTNDVVNAEGGGGASSIDPFAMCSAAVIKQKGENGGCDGAGGLSEGKKLGDGETGVIDREDIRAYEQTNNMAGTGPIIREKCPPVRRT